MTNPPEASAPRFTLLASEDWWAIWLGGLLITLTAIGVITGVAGVGRWTGDPTAAFANGLVPLAVLGIGFALLTGVAARWFAAHGHEELQVGNDVVEEEA